MSRRPSARSVVVVAALALLVLAAPTCDPTPTTSPTAPSNLRITATSPTSVSLAWDASTHTASSWWYCVQQNGDGCLRVDPPGTTFTRPNLLPDKTHTFSVYAIDSAGNRSANSNTVSFTTPADTTPPGPPPTISVTRLLPTRALITWTKATDNTSPQIWTTLVVNGTPAFVDRLGPPTWTLWTLAPATSYELQVSVRDRDGNVATGPPLVITTPPKADDVAPTAPTNLRGDTPDGLDLDLRWDASTDDTDAAGDIRYDIYIDGVLGGMGLGTSTVASCLSDGPAEIVVKAVDTSGNVSGPSNTVTVECSL